MSRHMGTSLQNLCDHMQGRTPSLFLDFDGTLTPIVDSPGQAQIDDNTRQILAGLSTYTEVAIISGRLLRDVQSKVALASLSYAGSHGTQIHLRGGRKVYEPCDFSVERKEIDKLKEAMQAFYAHNSDIIIEHKNVSLAIHYRRAPHLEKEILQRISSMLRHLPSLTVIPSKMAFDVRPAKPWNKGTAIKYLLDNNAQRLQYRNICPIYIGDDFTDRVAFAQINALNGISIFVGPPEEASEAKYYLNSTDEVVELLSGLLDDFRKKMGINIGRVNSCIG